MSTTTSTPPSRSPRQRLEALEKANATRMRVAWARQALKSGEIAPVEFVVIPEVANTQLVDILRWLPRAGLATQIRLGALAVKDGVNLLNTVKRSPAGSLEWVADNFVREFPSVEPRAPRLPRMRRDGVSGIEAEVLRRRAETAEAEAKGLREALALYSEKPAGRRGSAVVHAEAMIARLADAIEQHRRDVTDQAGPVDKWARADETLWAAKNSILAADAPRLKAVA